MKAVTTVVLALGFSGLVASIALHASQQSLGTSSAAPADAGISGAAAAAADASVTADDTVDAQDSDSLGTLQERIARGFEIAPVPLNLEGKDHDLVGLGSYLVNAVGGCNDCHTNPPYAEGHDPFLAQSPKVNASRYLAGGTAFGPFVSRNLTPRANGRPANLTFEQFRIVMRRGYDLKGRAPFVPTRNQDRLQVMPWPVYSHMRRTDLRAIYEYLRAIPSLPSAPPS
jgi:hypothetical protein